MAAPMTIRHIDTSLGRITVVADDDAVLEVHLGGVATGGDLEIGSSPVADAAIAQLVAYGEGSLRRFDLPLDPAGTAFQRAVWSATSSIDFGEFRTYGWVADRLGRPNSARAVGQALGRCPMAIVVPCHRVVASAGIGGYGGDLGTKARLLRHEGIDVERLASAHP